MGNSFLDQSRGSGINKSVQLFPWVGADTAGVYGATGGLMAPSAPLPAPTPTPVANGAVPASGGLTDTINADKQYELAGDANAFTPTTIAEVYKKYANLFPAGDTAVAPAQGSIAGSATTSAQGKAVIDNASKYVGIMYKWGGTGNGGYDCSGFTQRVARDSGVSIPRTAQAQLDWFKQRGKLVNFADAKPGDLLYFRSNGPSGRHTGIYLGNGMMVDANSTGKPIGQRSLANYMSRLLGVGQLGNTATRAPAPAATPVRYNPGMR